MALVAVEILVSAVLLYYLRDLLLSPEKISSTTGPQEGYYWTAAQYQLAFLRLENQAVLYASGRDKKIEPLKFRRDILQSKFRVFASPSELTSFFSAIPEYHATIRSLQTTMQQIDRDIERIEQDDADPAALLSLLRINWPAVVAIANNTRETEIKHREKTIADFYRKREIIFIGGALLLALLIVAVFLLRITLRRYREVIVQQRAALQAEQTATAAAQAATQAKNTFLAVVSHELRTPLQSITAAVDILIDQSGDKRNEKLLSRLESALLQLETQMNDLTDYVRLESGRLELRQSMFIVQEILKRTVNDILPFARKKGLAVHCLDTTDDTLYISDPERIGQILNNLLSNAIKYTDQGEITIRTSSIVGPCNADLLTIEVEDTGPGIPDDQIRHVFEPFSQINRTSTRKTGGMGMGLAIVQGLTTLLGGEIKADSRPGHGAVFRLTVPLDRANNSIKENTDFIISLPPAIRVLVVDDDEPARAAFRDLLDTLGIASDLARNAEEAMAKLCARRYDTVLLDIEMPGKDGHMLARELRSSAGPNRQVPIIVVSAHAVDGDKMPLYQSCLVKPVRLPPLRMALWRVLNKEVQNE